MCVPMYKPIVAEKKRAGGEYNQCTREKNYYSAVENMKENWFQKNEVNLYLNCTIYYLFKYLHVM